MHSICLSMSSSHFVQVASPEQGSSFARSSKQYWGGCFWRVLIKKADDGVGAYLVPSMSWGKPAADAGKPALGLYSVEVRECKSTSAARQCPGLYGNCSTVLPNQARIKACLAACLCLRWPTRSRCAAEARAALFQVLTPSGPARAAGGATAWRTAAAHPPGRPFRPPARPGWTATAWRARASR